MKQTLSKEQSDNLIGLGYPQPLSDLYTVGELIGFLIKEVTEPEDELVMWHDVVFSYVKIYNITTHSEELIDALYSMCMHLKM